MTALERRVEMMRSKCTVMLRAVILLTIAYQSALPARRAHAIGQTCVIPPANQISADVRLDRRQDPSTKLYTYTFDVVNRSISRQDIWSIIVETTGRIAEDRKPPDWFFDPFVDRPLVGWSVPEPRRFLKPGQGDKFALISPDPPGSGWMYLEGYAPVPKATPECQDLLETNPALFDPAVNSVRIAVTVPQAYEPLRVAISPTTINLAKLGDVVRIIAFGERGLPPLREVNVDTWTLGPAGAAEMHGTVHPSDINGDGVEDVELHFLVGELGVRRGDRKICLFGRVDGHPPQWLQGCATVSVP